MLLRRLQNTGIALLGVMLPFLIACLVMFTVIGQRERLAERPASPNPQKAPLWMVGPIGLVGYADPWWCGVFLPLMTIVGPPVALFVVAVPFVWPVASGKSSRWWLLLAISLLLGVVIAAPWVLAFVRLLWRA